VVCERTQVQGALRHGREGQRAARRVRAHVALRHLLLQLRLPPAHVPLVRTPATSPPLTETTLRIRFPRYPMGQGQTDDSRAAVVCCTQSSFVWSALRLRLSVWGSIGKGNGHRAPLPVRVGWLKPGRWACVQDGARVANGGPPLVDFKDRIEIPVELKKHPGLKSFFPGGRHVRRALQHDRALHRGQRVGGRAGLLRACQHCLVAPGA
jgi:hypothetical protein